MDLSCPCYTFVDLCHRDFAKDPFTLWNGIFYFNRLTNKDYSFPKTKNKRKRTTLIILYKQKRAFLVIYVSVCSLLIHIYLQI